MTDFTLSQLDQIHEQMCLAWAMKPNAWDGNHPEWPPIWEGEDRPPWEPRWGDFLAPLFEAGFPSQDARYQTHSGNWVRDNFTRSLYRSIFTSRVDVPTIGTIQHGTLEWEHIFIIRQYINELSDIDPAPETLLDIALEPGEEDVSDTYEEDDMYQEYLKRGQEILDTVMHSDSRVMLESHYIELSNVLKDLYLNHCVEPSSII